MSRLIQVPDEPAKQGMLSVAGRLVEKGLRRARDSAM
jgi:hypothetical protein